MECFISIEHTPRSGVDGLGHIATQNCFRNCQTVNQSVCTTLHSHQSIDSYPTNQRNCCSYFQCCCGSTISPALIFIWLFNFSHLTRCLLIHCTFVLNSLGDKRLWASFLWLNSYLYIFFGETFIRFFGHFLIVLLIFWSISCKCSSYSVSTKLYKICNLKNILPLCGSFHFLNYEVLISIFKTLKFNFLKTIFSFIAHTFEVTSKNLLEKNWDYTYLLLCILLIFYNFISH